MDHTSPGGPCADIYIRVSTEEQAIHGLSLAAQRESLIAWAQSHNIKVHGIYADEGISARKPATKRPALQRILEDVRAGAINLILFTKLDRWFRNIGEYYKVQEVLDKYHVNWQTTQEDYETATASGRLKVNIMLSVAQDEADRTSERIKRIFESKRQHGEALTGQPPHGYRLTGKYLEKDPAAAPGVEAFFRTFLASGSVSEAQRSALAAGHAIPYLSAYRMLRSPAYYGHYFDTDGMCPPYISKAEFDKIQSMCIHRPPRKTKENRVYLFSGLIFCGDCGKRMNGSANQNRKSPHYHCPGHFLGNHTGTDPCINRVCQGEKKLEAYLLASIEEKMAVFKAATLKAWNESKTKSHKPEIAATRRRLARLKDLYLNELMSLDEYKRDKAELEESLATLEALEKPQEEPDFSAIDQLLSEGWRTTYADLDNSAKRDFWRILIKEIRIYPDRRIEYTLNG